MQNTLLSMTVKRKSSLSRGRSTVEGNRKCSLVYSVDFWPAKDQQGMVWEAVAECWTALFSPVDAWPGGHGSWPATWWVWPTACWLTDLPLSWIIDGLRWQPVHALLLSKQVHSPLWSLYFMMSAWTGGGQPVNLEPPAFFFPLPTLRILVPLLCHLTAFSLSSFHFFIHIMHYSETLMKTLRAFSNLLVEDAAQHHV